MSHGADIPTCRIDLVVSAPTIGRPKTTVRVQISAIQEQGTAALSFAPRDINALIEGLQEAKRRYQLVAERYELDAESLIDAS